MNKATQDFVRELNNLKNPCDWHAVARVYLNHGATFEELKSAPHPYGPLCRLPTKTAGF